ncbi:GAG-pre-integrase domain, partial [Arabidopsis suecica]
MIGRADIEGSKSNVAMNAWLPQASYPCARLALNENPKNPNPKNRGYYSSATLFIGDTVHRRHCSSAILFIAVTIHRRYCSSRLLFIAVTIHRRYCSSRLLFIAATVHRDYCSSPLLFIAATIHRRYCSSPLLFIAATVHRGYYSSPLLFIAATVHRRYCSSRLLFIAATVHRRYCSSPLLFVAATVHRGYYSSPLLFITILFIVGTVHRSYCSSRYCSSSTLFIAVLFIAVLFAVRCSSRIRKNPKNLTTSKVIDHTAVTVVDGKDVVVATITHPAVGTTITVDVDPIPAVVEGEDDVVFPNHNTRPNEYVIDVVLKGRGCGHYNSSGRGNHYNRGCRPNSGRGRGRGRCDIRLDGFHIETKGEGNKEFLNIIEITKGHKKVLETIPALSTSLYYAKIDMIEANMAMNKEFIEKFTLWHDRLGHPGHSMMRKLITNSKWHTLREKRVIPKNLTCEACSQGKLIIRPSPAKVNKETLNFLERIQGDICGPIHPPCGTFRYFMVLIDASTRWSHVCLLSTRNQGFARLLAQIIRLRAHFPDFPLKTIRLDNAGEFTSQAFNDYCMSMGVSVEHPVAHVHTQNGLAESFIKRIQLIARPLLMRSKLPVAAWGHTVLHASELIRIRPSSEHRYSPSQLLMGHEPDISHLKTFGCAVYVPIAPPHRTKMGPKRRMGIYVGFDSPTIIKYLEPTTGDLFKARYADCHFNESEFPTLGGETNKLGKDIKEISWNQTSLNWQDPRTLACESEVQKIINLQKLANELPDSFVDPKKVTKSYIPACNAPVRIDIQKGINEIATESNAQVHWIIYMRLPEGIELKDKDKKVSRDQYCIRLNKSLYGLKQSGRMWYNRLSDYLVREGYKNDPISPCIFIKKFANEGFVIIAVYVDDLNILGTSGEIAQTVEYLKKEFEMKDLGKTKFCLGLQLEYVNNGILVHQKAYTEKVLKRFNMDQAHPLSSPMVVRSLGLDSDSFGPKKDEEEVLGPEVPYLSAIGALMYLASHTRPDICFAVNLLCLNLVHDQPKGTGKAVFFKAQLLQHQRPSYLKTTQPVIAQLKDSYIKGDRTKHILPKFFFTHDLQRDGEVRVMCRPSQTPHLTMSSARIDPPKRALGPKTGVVPRLRLTDRIPLVRTSSELTVRRPGKALERAVPSPSPGRHAATRSRRGSSSSSPPTADGFGTGTPEPSPQSQSFSRSYGSILPTSLAYIVPSTRGCSPWRPDAVMSTTGRERHSVLRIFKGRRGRTGHHATCGALPAAGPYLRLSRFQGGQAICTDGRSARARALGFTATAAPSYSSRPGSCPDGRVGHRNPASGSSRIASSAYQKWPTWSSRFRVTAQQSSRHNSRPSSSYPEGNFGGNQLLDGSISLSPLYPSQTNDLHVSMLTLEPLSEDQGRSAVHPRGIPPISFLAPYGFTHPLTRTHVRLLGPCFKTGRMGSPQADARSTQMPRHAAAAVIRVGPRPESIGGPDCSVPHPTGTHRRPPSVPSRQFQALFDSLFKVLFIFTSRYLFAIGLSHVFSLGRNLPPDWGCIPKHPTRRQRLVVRQGPGTTGLSPSLAPLSRELRPGPSLRTLLQTTIRTPKTSDFKLGSSRIWVIYSFRTGATDNIKWIMFTTACGTSRRPWLGFRPTACGNTRETSFRPASAKEYRGRRFVTPRQTCPRPEGWGATCVQRLDGSRDSAIHTKYRISLRSSSMREPRYPLPRVVLDLYRSTASAHTPSPGRRMPAVRRYAKPRIRRARDRLRNRPTESGDRGSRVVLFWTGIDNDPSAGSPTETLLRLLLPLNDKSVGLLEHSNFFKVTAPEARPGQLRPGAYHDRRDKPTGAHQRRTGRPIP